MSQNYLIGLGGSGGKVITELYRRLREEKGNDFVYNNVHCIAIDTDQDELNKLAEMGVRKVCISSAETVGQMINHLGDDITDWCPDTREDSAFFCDIASNGASQCRLKSRICLANFLKNANNSLDKALEESTRVSPHGENSDESVPNILIVSSIAGGTGSGIFIQVALYIKEFFRKYALNVKVHGLFACPELFEEVVDSSQVPSLYANAYAVVRELNAFNLICGSAEETVYGKDLDIDIEISSKCEGKLFEKDAEGRYGDKPYDLMYFINKINFLSKTLGSIEAYYNAMADIAYSHLYIETSGKLLTTESNEMHPHVEIPTAIYGSAGASSIKYPYEDIVEYFASRSIKESVSQLWSTFDKKWYDYLEEKNIQARSYGRTKYKVKPGERADEYIKEFEEAVKTSSVVDKSDFSFLKPMIENNSICTADLLLNSIVSEAESEIKNDPRINEEKRKYKIQDVDKAKSSILKKINDYSSIENDKSIFSEITTIDATLETYCRKSIEFVLDNSISFANRIYCDNKDLWRTYDNDKSPISLLNSMLYNIETGEWVHPLAARYLLYKFEKSAKTLLVNITKNIGDDADDFYQHLINNHVKTHRTILSSNQDNLASNVKILEDTLSKFRGKKDAKIKTGQYFSNLRKKVTNIDEVLSNALVYFSLVKVLSRIEGLIEVYETFFDNIDDFVHKAATNTMQLENKHEKSTTDVYVCASSEIKDYLYEKFGRGLNEQSGDSASLISKAIFDSMRIKAAEKRDINSSKSSKIGKKTERNNIFEDALKIVVDSSKNNPDIKEHLDLNIIEAMMLEYRLLKPDYDTDEQNYTDTKDEGPKKRINSFITTKFASLVRFSAPCLMYDIEDQYKITNPNDNNIKLQNVSTSYRYITHNAEIYEEIKKLTGGSEQNQGTVESLYREIATELPKSSTGQTIVMSLVNSKNVDRYTILCHSTVQCLQPYQINAFDELKGGDYYIHYAKRISEVERTQKFSRSPHLDKRWHKHGKMPYINVSKENEYNKNVIRAFLFAVIYGAIGYNQDESLAYFVFSDKNFVSESELMFYNGKPIPYRYVNRAIAWLADNEALVATYAKQFKEVFENEIERLNIYSETVQKYKTGITDYAKLLRQMKRNSFRAIKLFNSASGKARELKSKDNISILELARLVHTSEETEIDKNYGELIIEVLCDVIKDYAKAPYNAKKISAQDKESEAYTNYLDICQHIAESFLTVYSKAVNAKPSKKSAKGSEEKKTYFGISDEDLTLDTAPTGNTYTDSGYDWALKEIKKNISF